MLRRIGSLTVVQTVMAVLLSLWLGADLGAQAQMTAPRPNPNIKLQGLQRAQPPSQPAAVVGSVRGFVYWNTKSSSHNPPASCSGLAITVNVGSSSGSWEQYKSLATINNLTYEGQVRATIARTQVSVYDVCAYEYDQLPVGTDLQVKLTITNAAAYTPVSNPRISVLGPIKISTAQCSALPLLTKPTISDLLTHWESCHDTAFHVNFYVLPASQAGGGFAPVLLGAGGAKTGMLANGSQSGMLSPGVTQGMLQGVQKAQTQSGTRVNPGSQVELNPQPLPPRQKLTNANVIAMVKSGLSESVIMSSIQSSTKGFDLSPRGCLALNQAQVSRAVLDAMGDGSVRPCLSGADDLNPQPLPPRGTSALPAMTAPSASSSGTRKISKISPKANPGTTLGAIWHSQKITNPKAALRDAEIIAVLRNQRQAAEAEDRAMKLSLHPLAPQPSHTMSSSTGASSRYASMTPSMLPNVTLTCAHDPTMRILNVNGGPHPAVFTQNTQYDFYTITGCSFGDPGTNSKVYIYYQSTFHEDFQIDEWNDNYIKIHLDPNLNGIDDQNNLTLVVQRADGKQASKTPYQFYAARQTVHLEYFPKNHFSLNLFRPDWAITKGWQVIYTSRSLAGVVPHLSDQTAEAHWALSNGSSGYDANGNLEDGSDIYDFSQLHPTFVLDSASLSGVNLSCTDPNNNVLATSKNHWGIEWYGPSGLQVVWQAQACNPTPGSCGGGVGGACFLSLPESNYGVDVWVTGPRGLDPWTGKQK